jgi:hypothetical protein
MGDKPMKTVAVYEVRTAVPVDEIALLFRERITKPQNRALRLMIRNKFIWSFYSPEAAASSPFAQFEAREEPTFAVAALAVSPDHGGGILRQAADALAGGDFLLEIWDRGGRRDARLTVPAATGWKSCASNFVAGLAEKNPGTQVMESVQRVAAP